MIRTSSRFFALLTVALLYALFAPAGALGATNSICAKVRMEVRQELALERQGFDAVMTITNDLASIPVENVSVTVWARNSAGEPVELTTDPDDPDALFFIRLDSLKNIADVAGAGRIEPSTAAEMHWLLIPAPGASNGLATGARYEVGATLTYKLAGEVNNPAVFPDFITVKPMPSLTLQYFLPTDVYGDDAFTTDVVETPIPFPLGLRIKNSGPGVAKAVNIESAQPKIVSKDSGLLVGFAIDEASVNGQLATKSLRVNYGDIPAGGLGIARWTMTCSLSGIFTQFDAKVAHADELGGQLTSLVEGAESRELIREVVVDLPGRDPIGDFLAVDGTGLTAFESQNYETPVADVSASSSLTLLSQSGEQYSYRLIAGTASGPVFLKIADPLGGAKEACDIVRSDGKIVRKGNFWLSKSRNKITKEWEYYFCLFDTNSTGSYNVKFDTPVVPPLPPVIQFIADLTTWEGHEVDFLVQASDPNGTLPTLTLANKPAGAIFEEVGVTGGLRTMHLRWTPAIGQSGLFPLTFTASDGALSASRSMKIQVNSAFDTDGDGLPDWWELKYFGDLTTANGTGDAEGDGYSDLDEYQMGTDPSDANSRPNAKWAVRPMLSLRDEATLALRSDGSLWAWGRNYFGELGDGTTIDKATPVQVVSDHSFKAASIGWENSAAVGTDGSLWAWGWNGSGQLGDGTQEDKHTPVQIGTDTDWSVVVAGNGHTLALKADGSLWAWGANGAGQLGDGTQDASLTPIRVGKDNDWTAIASGSAHSLALKADGSLWAWGGNGGGQLGDGTTVDSYEPMLVDSSHDWIAIAAGNGHSLGLKADGSLWGWGSNWVGELGDDVMEVRSTPTRIGTDSDWVSIAAGEASSAALKADGAYRRWGETSDEAIRVEELTGEDCRLAATGWQQGMVAMRNGSLRSLSGYPGAGENWKLWPMEDVTAPTVAIDPPEGTLAMPVTVTLTATDDFDPTPTILYTTDGTEPNRFSQVYRGPLALNDTTTIKYFAEDFLGNISAIAAAAYTRGAAPANLVVNVSTSMGKSLTGVKVYAFTQTDSYTGKNAVVDATGMASFEPTALVAGYYKFRVDYLGSEFWSDVIDYPAAKTVSVLIEEATASLTVMQAGVAEPGVKVYLFGGGGNYLNLYGVTDENGSVSFDLPAGVDYYFRADLLGGQYFSQTATAGSIPPGGFDIDCGGGRLTLTVDDGTGAGIPAVSVYLFRENGAYQNVSRITGPQGEAYFDLPSGRFSIRCDYMGYQFWSDVAQIDSDASYQLSIPHRDVAVSVGGLRSGVWSAKQGVKVHLFTDSNSYQNWFETTDQAGEALFHLPQMAYKVRADYLGFNYWSEPLLTDAATISIPEASVDVTVTQGAMKIQGLPVYVFNSAGGYENLSGTTDDKGKVRFTLPTESFQFRTDYLSNHYWSALTPIAPDRVNQVGISTGGGYFLLNVDNGNGAPLCGMPCYLFSGAGNYLNKVGTPDSAGETWYELSDGEYKFRADYKGYQFWSDAFTVPALYTGNLSIPVTTSYVTLSANDGTTVTNLQNVPTFLFTEAGEYVNESVQSDAEGVVSYELPNRNYKVRADYLGSQYWSALFNQTNATIEIEEGVAELSVTSAGMPLASVPVYVFTDGGSYLNGNSLTDSQGRVAFKLPEGAYRFRCDYQGNQYFAGATVQAHQTIPVELSTGGALFQLTIDKGDGSLLGGAKAYLFSQSGTYLNTYETTDPEGSVFFPLADGSYKFRVDHIGYQFWSPVVTVPQETSALFSIPHQKVTMQVRSTYQGQVGPISNVKAYLFNGSGVYQNQYLATDSTGQVRFNLPEKGYKIRADYMGYQFWSAPFTWSDGSVDIPHGYAEIYVTMAGVPQSGAKVYLYTAAGSYLGSYLTTNGTGKVYFYLPNMSFKFRADYAGRQVWTDVLNVVQDVVNQVQLELGP